MAVTARGARHTGFHHVTRHGRVKSAGMWDFVEPLLEQWWHEQVGLTRNDYFTKSGLRAAFTYLRVVDGPATVDIDAAVQTSMTLHNGAFPGRGDSPARYGGRNEFELRNADGERVTSWVWNWVWFWPGPDGVAGLLHEPAPDLGVIDQSPQLDPPPSRPVVPPGERIDRFRWTERETDVNQHVFFLSYLERGENGAANAGLARPELNQREVWFVRPAYAGDLMHMRAEPDGDDVLVELRRAEHGELSVVVRFSEA